MPQDLASLTSRCPQLPAAASPLGHPSQHLSHPPVSRPGDEWSQAHRMAELAEPRPSPASSKEEAEAWRKDTAGTARAGSRGAESGFPMKRRVPGVAPLAWGGLGGGEHSRLALRHHVHPGQRPGPAPAAQGHFLPSPTSSSPPPPPPGPCKARAQRNREAQ